MTAITLPLSPETRAALEKLGWQVQRINPGYVILIKSGATVGLWADGNHTISATAPEWSEVATILGIVPVDQRKAAAYGELRDRIMDAAADLDAAFVLLENSNPTDAKRHLSAAISRLMLGVKREHVSIPFDLARRYREAWFNHDQRRVKDAREELERAIAILFRDAVVSSDRHAPIQDQAAAIQAERGPVVPRAESKRLFDWAFSGARLLSPRPPEDGGPSPSPTITFAAANAGHTHYFEDCPDMQPGDVYQTTMGKGKPPNVCATCFFRVRSPQPWLYVEGKPKEPREEDTP